MSELAAARVQVIGRVQGVWFRASTQEEAARLSLAGWVRNMPDGNVEAFFQGPRDLVEKAIAWCHHGPPLARVTEVRVQWVEPDDDAAEFQVRY